MTLATTSAIPSLFQQSPALQAFMFLQAIDPHPAIGQRTYLKQATTMSKSLNKSLKQNSPSLKSRAIPQSLYRPTRSPPAKPTQLSLPCDQTSVNWEIVCFTHT
ncbi:hypothetical protein IQ270_28585 [Microcoleus sp. LEGE 07076]|uniref:hypothetical protein n=1 Tax=Microcoleus sp. LEGE 07076 TaxID=915322 RepID=UPI00187E00D8|nr:hypothetical protein [Microcoleus sp. LEGE 07076]MBE9188484.1 hypothetical protein [Microcoleus sp. LEGE 07076]